MRAVLTQPQPRHGEPPEDGAKLFVFLKRRESCAPENFAAACDAVVFVAAGLPTLLKPAPTPNLRLR